MAAWFACCSSGLQDMVFFQMEMLYRVGQTSFLILELLLRLLYLVSAHLYCLNTLDFGYKEKRLNDHAA